MNEDKRQIKRTEEYKISKFEFYQKFTFWVVVVASVTSVGYWVSDCLINNEIVIETIFPRVAILIPLMIFLFINKKVNDYRVLLYSAYIQTCIIVLCTLTSAYFLVDKSHVSEGMVVLQIVFLTLGFGASFGVATFFHLIFLIELLLSHCFNHYDNLDVILSLNLPLMVAIIAIQWFMCDFYLEHFKTANKLERLSYYDMLTDVHNRNIVQMLVESDGRKLISDLGEECCVLLLDIDFFKQVNDVYGHQAGDRVLRFVAQLVKERLREGDYIIRWGGEEFVIILANAKVPQAFALAEEMRRTVENRDNGVCPISISVGVAQYDGVNYRTAINRADEMLYLAKSTGRNRVCVYERDATMLDFLKKTE